MDPVKLRQELSMLFQGRHPEPHRFLGLQKLSNGQKEIRIFDPSRSEKEIVLLGVKQAMTKVDERGLFTLMVSQELTIEDYQIPSHSLEHFHDPFAFSPSITLADLNLFLLGKHPKLYEMLGVNKIVHQGVEGYRFAVWAPRAKAVSLVGDFNRWKERAFPMRRLSIGGVWEIFVPLDCEGANYKYSILTESGQRLLKSDPFAHQFELRPLTASIVTEKKPFIWTDQEHMERRRRHYPLDGPINVYEMHLGFWLNQKKKFLNYREIATDLVNYVKDMGYTHVELMPITEHPYDESWGYQVTGYFAPTSRYGTLTDFKYMINHLHMHGIPVILDWAPGHFPADDFSLVKFDGAPLFEVDDPVMGRHPEWTTCLFDYSRAEVKNFLLSSAEFWLEEMHIDAIRVDAVGSMLYLDFGRENERWTPNHEGGPENLHAISFLKELNETIHEKYPGVLTIAEDVSLFPNVTKPVAWGGLGFDLKWNIGWAGDFAKVMEKKPSRRHSFKEELLNSYENIFKERYILPISHDEVGEKKGSFPDKTPLDSDSQFADLRLYYSAAICHPGKNLFFMGLELAQYRNWDRKDGLDWHVLRNHHHILWKRFVRKIHKFYLENPALWEIDFDEKGFAWIDAGRYNPAVLSFMRKAAQQSLVCVHNFSDSTLTDYTIRVEGACEAIEVFNTDSVEFGGTDVCNQQIAISDRNDLSLRIPPLATVVIGVKLDA